MIGSIRPQWVVRSVVVFGLLMLLVRGTGTAQTPTDAKTAYPTTVLPFLKKYCLDCHSTKVMKGSLDLEQFSSFDHVRKNTKVWQQIIEQLEADEMPPKKKPQPTADERKKIVEWTRGVLDAEARARSGDPGAVPLRRLSNTEYDCTIRDLTGVDLRPTREFPVDGAAGEGFTNAAEGLSDISPTLLNKYLNAAKEIADHAVLLPDGFRFSPSKTRRDWTVECNDRLRKFYAGHVAGEGTLPLQAYLVASVRHRVALQNGTTTPEAIATKEKLNPQYFAILWKGLNDKTAPPPLSAINHAWRETTEGDIPQLLARIASLQAEIWKTARIGSYVRAEGNRYFENLSRQIAVDPPAVEVVPLRFAVKPTPGQAEVTLYLTAGEERRGGLVLWQKPRFEGNGKPTLLLKAYPDYGPAFEVDYPTIFTGSANYLSAVVEVANAKEPSVPEVAKKHGLDPLFLKRWAEVLAIEPFKKDGTAKTTPAVPLELLSEKYPGDPARPAISGWRKKGTDLPVLVTNASDKVEQIPGRVVAHGVSVHPMPNEFVAVAWKSPIAGSVRINASISHAHPACGNGVAWWLEHRRDGRATPLGEGNVDLGKDSKHAVSEVKVEKGDVLVLAVDARGSNHVCDLTEIAFTITENDRVRRVWDLAADVADTVQAGNPHADKQGNPETWSFVRGPSKGSKLADPLIPTASVLGRWRTTASDPDRKAEATKLADQVQTLLSGTRPTKEGDPDRVLYDRLVGVESPLFNGVEVVKLAKPRKGVTYGLPKQRFVGVDFASDPNSPNKIILPAALFVGREFVVECRPIDELGDRMLNCRVSTSPNLPSRGEGSILASPTGKGYQELLAGRDAFRRLFPLFLCFPNVVPTDEVVCLKMFHREDEPLNRLCLNESQRNELDRLWQEHRFVSRQPVAEEAYLPQFIGFVTQDQPKEMLAHFESQRPVFKQRADEFLKSEEAAIPKQLDALLEFAGRAYRRPVQSKEKADLLALYQSIRAKGAAHEEAFHGVLTRVLVSPAFLFRVEQAPAGKEPASVTDWELATRLSYFLWSSIPDDELRKLAGTNQLRDPKVMAAQVERMLKDERLRSLAIEFGTQWIHVRGFDELKEKNEKLFPTFDPKLRSAIYEESILFFQDLFKSDRSVTQILDADYTFLNETLAKHYGIPGVTGPEWRRVEGVRKYGRGGILGLASVQAKQSGASRSSPVLRGNWVVETLLGEKLPRPPANVPQLPESEGDGGLSVRQLVEKHAKAPECAVCHVRVDPFGFALEKYDPIGRLRAKDLAGLEIDSKAKLRDGSEFDGIDGLRTYLLTKKKDVVVRLFCKRLLGYALGRSVTLSDTSLLDEMVAELNRNDGRISAAVRVIVRSPQFRMVRGSEFVE